MGSRHAHAPWRKAVLIPFWIIQLLIGLLELALLGWAVEIIVRWQSDNEFCDNANDITCNWGDNISTEAKIVVPIWIAMLAICLILTITEIVLLARHQLKPKTFVVFNTIKCTIWTALFVLDIVSFVDSNLRRTTSFVGLIIEGVLWLCFIIPLIYGSIIYHRTRHSTTYAPVVDPANPTHVSTVHEYSIPTAYTGYTAKAYASSDIEAQSEPVSTRASGERGLSYNHQRDTRFEAFRRTSYGKDNDNYNKPYSPDSFGYRGNKTIPSTGGGFGDGIGSPEIPQVIVQHHDGEMFEMENNHAQTNLRS